MSYKTLMVHVDVDAELPGRVNVAAELADRFQGHIIGIAGWAPMSVFPPKAANASASAGDHLQDMKALLDRKGQQFLAAVGANRHAEWRSVANFPTEAIAREARAADLLIIGNARENRDPFRALDPPSLLLKAGRPVLVVPEATRSLKPRQIAIAWKDTREARRVIGDALPFLEQAESVMVVEFSEGGDASEVAQHIKDVAGYLRRHGIEVIAERVRKAEVGATEALLRLVRDESIDLIVAGAYGHSRVGEWAYGGVTRGLLRESPVCCLFSH
jgi:nucleotide-binding universal stress UspA family protein